jgi:hypothetical protein
VNCSKDNADQTTGGEILEDQDLPSLEEFMRRFQHTFGTPNLSAIAAETPALIAAFKKLHPVKTAATFAGLLAQKGLQSNCLRLEILIHLSLACCEGDKGPAAQFTSHAFKVLGQSICGRLEDPAEDVFVSAIYSARGNYRILEGIWESSGFYLQRFVNIVDRLPDTGSLDRLKDSVHALLKLSDLLCERANLVRYDLGNAIPEDDLPRKIGNDLANARRIVRFTKDDLCRAGIELRNLAPFHFKPSNRASLLDQTISHTDLERYPISNDGDDLVFLLPTAVSIAIRRYLIDAIGSGSNRERLLQALAHEYSKTLTETPLLGDMKSGVVALIRDDAGILAKVCREVDVGLYLNLVFFMDTLDGFEDDGFAGTDRTLADMADAIDERIDHCVEVASKNPEFHSGITLIISCGVGRGVSVSLNNKLRPGWRIDSISAPDLCTLSWTPNMKPLNLWRIYSARDKLAAQGLKLQNVNGLLNLVAWTRSLDGHLVPHASIPEEMTNGHGIFMVTQNALLDLRREVATAWDPHMEKDVHGNWHLVSKEGQSHFEEDKKFPIYVSTEREREGYPLGACITNRRTWWFELSGRNGTLGSVGSERWRMMATWLGKAAPILEKEFPSLTSGPILWRCVFSIPLEPSDFDMQQGNAEDARSAIAMSCVKAGRVITLDVSEGFDRALFNSDNIAEAALVGAFAKGVTVLAGFDTNSFDHAAVAAKIIGSSAARQTHALVARDFRDFMETLATTHPVTINRYDDAELKLGLGWRIRDQAVGPEISGKESCTSFLNNLVTSLEEEICKEVQKYGRQRLINAILFNSEVASRDRDNWRKTAAAVLALHDDQQMALGTMARHDYKLNGVLQASRILIEVAICESPVEGGLTPGKLDLSRMMACASSLFHIGGWSDAIRWDVMEPLLMVRPLGDVHANQDFIDNIADKFAGAASDVRFRDAAENYAKNLEERPFSTETVDDMGGVFLSAWLDEFGATLADFRRFVDEVEDIGVKEDQPVLCLPRSRLTSLIADKTASEAIVCALTLLPRPVWRSVPNGFSEKDRQPWRFRRRLSVVRRPLLQINHEPDPLVLVAPGMLRESFAYVVGNYRQGNFPDEQLGAAMRAFVGHARLKRGTEFEVAAADRLKALGWEVEHEISLGKLLGKKMTKNWGGIDVLAWHLGSRRILVIECKDVHYRKTYGEIAEQLSDFRGELKSDGKPDMLKKHLDRISIVREDFASVQKYLGMPDATEIESHLVFKNPVPMQHAADSIGKLVKVSLFDDLDRI